MKKIDVKISKVSTLKQFLNAELSAAHILEMSAELSASQILKMSAELSAAQILASELLL